MAAIRLGLFFFALLLFGHRQVLTEQLELPPIEQDWQAGNYLNVVGSLKGYLQGLGDDERNFGADYMMATSLTRLPEYHELGCRYFMSMARLYGQSHTETFDGELVVLQTAWNTECPPPPQAGVHVAPVILPPKRGQVLAEIP